MLRVIMQNPLAREMVQTEDRSTGAICGFKDGMLYRSHEFKRKFPSAVRLPLHIDDVEQLIAPWIGLILS